jgi:hypothetical protein
MSEEEGEYYEDDEPADDEPAGRTGPPGWMILLIGLPLFLFMVWCGYAMGQ